MILNYTHGINLAKHFEFKPAVSFQQQHSIRLLEICWIMTKYAVHSIFGNDYSDNKLLHTYHICNNAHRYTKLKLLGPT